MTHAFIAQELVQAERALSEGRTRHYEEMMRNVYGVELVMYENEFEELLANEGKNNG